MEGGGGGGGGMFEEIGCFDPNAPGELTAERSVSPSEPPPAITVVGSNNNSNCSLEDLSELHLSPQDPSLAAASASAHVHQLHINATPPNCEHHQFQSSMHQTLLQDPSSYAQQSNNWDNGYQEFVNLGPNHTTPDLLSLLQLPRSSLPPFANPCLQDIMMTSSSVSAYDPLFHLNFPLQHPNGTFLGVDQDQAETNQGVNLLYDEENNNLDVGLNRKGRGSKKRKIFPTERERRVHFKDRFGDLRSLIPNPTKNDRASIVGEAIDYIKELLRTIDEFKMLVEKKRIKRLKREGDDVVDENFKAQSEVVEQSSINKKNNALRCSWLKRKSKFTEVDVRIIDDEVTIKIVQKKKINSLLFVSKVIDQLQLDLHHVAGAQIGEHHSFLFNTKICKGSSVYASAIADRVMEVLEKQYMEALSMNNGYHCYSSD
ncbi:PREDICTED: transcription factor bHLH89-like [Camelina sativa]|uniref:Transcription factor bHLH89-like n=1 Tax=Camelina sativa TaxID=90675 RepID=A0ABM0VKV0_CAMSA|nr:PREDICTED: transcription factor bHLH89-like [Camelina sativa]